MSEYICPHCKNPIYDDEAILCLFCGEALNRSEKYFPTPKIIFIVIAALAILGFLLMMLK
jgi:predicted nucleic acid-binding Zn ribbon protein